jgi:hypothetical protein
MTEDGPGLPLDARDFLASVLVAVPDIPEALASRLLELAQESRGGRAAGIRRAFEELSGE